MLSLLASDITPPPGASEWMANLMYVVVSLTAVVVLIGKFKAPARQQREIVGDSLTVREAISYATTHDVKRMEGDIKTDLENLFRRLDHLSDHIAASEQRVLQAGEVRMEKLRAEITDLSTVLHNRVTDAMQTVAHLRGSIEGGLGYPKSKH